MGKHPDNHGSGEYYPYGSTDYPTWPGKGAHDRPATEDIWGHHGVSGERPEETSDYYDQDGAGEQTDTSSYYDHDRDPQSDVQQHYAQDGEV